MADVVTNDVFRSLVESAVDPMFTTDASGRYLYVNPAAAALLGRRQDEVVGRTPDDFFPPDVARSHRDGVQRVIETGETLIAEEASEIGGRRYWFSSVVQPLRDRSGRTIAVQAVVRDITRLRQADEALRKSDQRLRQAVRVSNIGIFEHDHVSGTIYQSPELREIFGLAEHDEVVIGAASESGRAHATALMDFIHPDDRARVAAAFAAAHDPAGDGIYDVEHRHIRPDGGVCQLNTRAQTFFDGDGPARHPVRTVGAVRDVTELRAAEDALRASDERLRQAVRVSHIGIFEHDHVTNRIYLSPEQREITGIGPDVEVSVGWAPPPGENVVSLGTIIHPDDAERVAAAMRRAHDPAGDGFYDLEYRHRCADGSIRWLTTRSQTFFVGEGAERRPVRTVGASRDITAEKLAEHEREALQAQLSQAQKMESVGRLAGGVAHDFNNMLNVILGWSSLALTELAPEHPLHDALHEIHTAAERSAGLTRQLLAFARRQTVAPKVVNLNDIVTRSLTMLGRMIGEDVQLVWNPGHPLWPIRMDPSQIDQILANLAANARDAIAGVGRVTITTGNVTVTAADRNDRAWFTPGDYVLLRVGDDGSGMDEETRSHIFEPFFTTKPAGQGTGLGLATVYGIVRQNEGMIDLTTRLGEGTMVAIYLPRFAGDRAAADTGGPDDAPEKGQEMVLLVEDEPMMLELSRTMLQKLGYRVLAAATPAAAIALADRYAGQIDLLFTDVVMPSMSGDDLAARLVESYPRLKCLFASGHFTHGLARGGAINEGVHFLQKPFSLADLAAKLREVLEPGA